MQSVINAGAQRNPLRVNIFRTTILAAALLGVYGVAQGAGTEVIVDGNNSTSSSPYNLDVATPPIIKLSIGSGGFASGNGTVINGDLPNLASVTAGGNLTLNNALVTNINGGPAMLADGAGSKITLSGASTVINWNGANAGGGGVSALRAVNGGFIDINGGTINTSGTVVADPLDHVRKQGILAGDGGTVTAKNLTINTSGGFSPGVQAFRTYGNPTAGDVPTVVNLDNVKINTTGSNYSVGIRADHKGASVVANGTDVNTTGAASHGVEVDDGATVALTGGSITTSGALASGVRAYTGTGTPGLLGPGAATVTGTKIITSGENAAGVLAGDSAEPTKGVVHLAGADITTSGASTGGLTAAGGANGIEANYGSEIKSTGSTIAASGAGSAGVRISGGASAVLNSDSVSSIGNDTGAGLYVNGAGSTLNATNVNVTTQRTRTASLLKPLGVGVYAINGGATTLAGGSITTANDWNVGLMAQQSGSSNTATGVRIQTNGLAATGVESWVATTDTAPASNTLNGGSITTLGSESYGLLAQNLGSTVTASNLSVNTAGRQSFGVNAYNGGVATLTNVDVTTSGANAHGVVMGTMSDTMRPGSAGKIPTNASHVSMTGGSITATGTGSSGVYLEDSGTVALNGVAVRSSGASIASQLTQAGQTQNITVGSGTTLTQNNGTLLQVNRTTAGMDGIVNLTLGAGSTSTGDVVDLDGLVKGGSDTRGSGGKTNFTVATGASWTGIIKGINDTAAGDGAAITDNGGAPIAGNVSGGSNSTIAFTNGATIGGGVSTGTGTQASFSGTTTIGGSVAGTGSTTSFNGATNIGGSVSGDGASYHFSQGQPTTIAGNVGLSNGSVLRGGTTTTPITINGNADVGSGSTLGGNLFVNGALGGSGGTLSPGNSVGTQSYATSGSFTGDFNMEVNAAGKSDLIIIRSGNLDLKGKNLIVGQEVVNGVANGGYVLNHDYTIVQTPGGNVVNTFDSQKLDSSFANTLVTLDPVKYAAQDVKISLSVDPARVAGKRAGLSSNQNATLDGVISVAGQNTAAGAALVSTDTKGVLNQLSGEAHASTQSALLNSSGMVVRAVSNRMRGNVGAGMNAGAPTAQASGVTPAGAMPRSAAYPLWAQVVGSWNSLKGDDNAAKTKTSLGGLFVGGDAAVGKGWRVGGALGFTDGNINVDDRLSTSSVRSYTGTIYGGNSWATSKGSVNFLAGAAYTRNNVNTRRSVNVGGNQVLKADYDVNAAQLFTELGYSFPVGRVSSVEPYLGVDWLSQHAKAFSESGGAAALQGDSQKNNVTSTTLGLRGKTALDLGNKQAILTGGLGWRHAAGDIDATRQVAFVQGNGAAFRVAGAPIARNAAVVDLGAEMMVGKNAAMGLGYSGQFGDGSSDNTGSLYLKVRF